MTCEACSTIPPVTSGEYALKGGYETVGGLRSYITGPATASIGLIAVYDIFGLASQTLQGADLLSAALNAVVIVPDFFEGEGGGAKASWFANATEESEKEKTRFMGKAMAFGEWTGLLGEVVKGASTKWEGVRSWGAYGLCWGGKILALTSGPDTPFKATGQVHPGRLAAADALTIQIPHIVLASNGEDAAIVAEYAKILVGDDKPHVVETYGDMHHGWMGARAKLDEENNLKEYERGYNQLAAFFSKHL